MFDSQNFQSLTREAVKNQVILKAIHAPGPNIFQSSHTEWPRSSFPWLLNKASNGFVNRFQESSRGIRVAYVNLLEVAERIQFGVMPYKEFQTTQGHGRRAEGAASAAKWPGRYFFMGLRREWRRASSNSLFEPSCSTNS